MFAKNTHLPKVFEPGSSNNTTVQLCLPNSLLRCVFITNRTLDTNVCCKRTMVPNTEDRVSVNGEAMRSQSIEQVGAQ